MKSHSSLQVITALFIEVTGVVVTEVVSPVLICTNALAPLSRPEWMAMLDAMPTLDVCVLPSTSPPVPVPMD